MDSVHLLVAVSKGIVSEDDEHGRSEAKDDGEGAVDDPLDEGEATEEGLVAMQRRWRTGRGITEGRGQQRRM